MNSFRKFFLSYAVIVLSNLPSKGETPIERYGELPWHLTDVFMRYDKEFEFTELSIDLELLEDLPPNGNRLFIVPLSSKINDVKFYFGINTLQCLIPDEKSKKANLLQGDTFRCSRFDCKSKSCFNLHDDSRGYLLNVEENPAIMCCKGNSKAGIYTFILKTEQISDPNKISIMLSVKNHKEKTEHKIGSFFFSGKTARLSQWNTPFFEIVNTVDPISNKVFTKQDILNSGIPKCNFVIGNLRINDKVVLPTSIDSYYPNDVPQNASVRLISNTSDQIQKKIKKHMQNNFNIVISSDNTVIDRSKDQGKGVTTLPWRTSTASIIPLLDPTDTKP